MRELLRCRGGINWLASYPKSGNTWLRMMLSNYFSKDGSSHDINASGVTAAMAASRRQFDESVGVPSADLLFSEVQSLRPYVYAHLAHQNQRPIWMKVHDAQQRLPNDECLFPAEASCAAIYIVRDPRDVAVSFSFHAGLSLDECVVHLCDPAHMVARRSRHQLPQILGTWSDHVASWVDQEAIPICVIRYEDMLADPAVQLTRALRFARPDITIDEARVRRAAEQSRFASLQAMEDRHGFREKPRGAERFFRSGRAGDWRNHLTPEHVRRLCNVHGGMMERFSYNPAELS